MGNTVACAGCGTIIDQSPSVPEGERIPCPQCGSFARAFRIHVGNGVLTFDGASAVVFEKAISLGSLLLLTVVVPGANTTEGKLIEAVTIPWFEMIAYILKDPTAMFKIPPRKWEEIIAGAYKQAGFDEVTLTPRSGDYGRDVIAIKKGLGTIRVIDQVKAYKPGHLVTAEEVRALIGVLHGDHASKGFLSTTSDFAPKLIEDPLVRPFIPARLGLINGKLLLDRLVELANKKQK